MGCISARRAVTNLSNTDSFDPKPWADEGKLNSTQGQDTLKLAKQSNKKGKESHPT